MSGDVQQLCTFVLGGELFGLEVERVQEIVRYQDVTPVPLAPPEVHGLMNLRGLIVPAIDLRRCLGLPDARQEAPTNVVLRTEDGPVSLLVDAIGEVLDVSEALYEAPPETLRGAVRELIRGVYKLDGGLLLLLSAEAAIRRSTELLQPEKVS